MSTSSSHDLVTRVALVAPAAGFRDTLRALIQGMDWVVIETEEMDFDQALKNLGQSKPDGVLIDLDDKPAEAMQFIAKLMVECPRCSPIVLSRRPEALVQAFRCGARALLDNPVDLEDLSVVLKNLSSGRSLNRFLKTTTTAVLSSRGGVGCTSLAVNLGCTLASEAKHQVVLLDLDFAMGTTDIALNLPNATRLHTLTAQLSHMDLQTLKNLLSRDPSGMALVPRPAPLADAFEITMEHLEKLMTLLRVLFNHLILDLSKGWTALDLCAMHLSDIILVVVQLEMSSIRNAVLMMECLRQEQLDGKVRVIMNRVGADFRSESLSLSKVEEVLGHRVDWQLPNDYKVMSEAWQLSQPLVRCAPKSKLQFRFAELAADLGKPAVR